MKYFKVNILTTSGNTETSRRNLCTTRKATAGTETGIII